MKGTAQSGPMAWKAACVVEALCFGQSKEELTMSLRPKGFVAPMS